ncbi:hypothetical protein DL96DRAFT_1624805 [Flagelloscypha sp. PMI_526]|nr:hypothetical protein DL96DRAFT_1624805 [Flagelloscypha sp. PMI_526]
MAQTTPVQYVLDPALLSMGASTSYSSNQSQQQSYGDSGGYLPTMTPQSLLNANPPHESPDHRLELDESDRPVKRQRLDDLGSAPEPTNGEGGHYPPTDARLPPILQVEKQQVTTSATQQASTTRRKTDAQFVCPVPHCGSTFTRKFNLRGHLRSHTEERPFACDHPGCGKKFARSHDCKRHRALHLCKSAKNTCKGCNKMFSRQDALNRHLKSDGAIECKLATERSREVVEDDNTDDRDDLLQLDFHSHSRDFESPSRFLGDIGMGLDVGKL